MRPGFQIEGFAYLVRNGHGQEFVLAGSFGNTRARAKKHLNNLNRAMSIARRPAFVPIALATVTLQVQGIDRTIEAVRAPDLDETPLSPAERDFFNLQQEELST